MGRPVPPLARRGTFRRRWSADDMAAAGQRRGFDFADGSVFPGSRPVPTDHSVRGFPAGLGLARSQWSDHVGARHSGAGAMAGLGALGDRPIRWNRADLLWWRLDRAGARPALATLVSGSRALFAASDIWAARSTPSNLSKMPPETVHHQGRTQLTLS